MFRLFNDTDHVITVTRIHRHGDEPQTTIVVPIGSPFEGTETVYNWGVSDVDAPCVLHDRTEPMTNRILRYADKQRQLETPALVGAGSWEDAGDLAVLRHLASAGEPLIDLSEARDVAGELNSKPVDAPTTNAGAASLE